MQQLGKYLILIGLISLVLGLVIYFLGDKFSWFGNLPGDIKYENKSGNFKFFSPITSMIIVSVVLTILLNLIRKFF